MVRFFMDQTLCRGWKRDEKTCNFIEKKVFYFIVFLYFFPGKNKKDNANRRRCRQSGSTCPSHYFPGTWTICRKFAQKSQRHYFATWCQNAYPKSFVRFLSLFLFDCKLKLFSSSWVFSSFLIIIVYSNYLSKICSKGLATLFYSLVSERLTQVIYKI